MRVGDHDSLDSPQFFDSLDGLVINVSDTIPEDISLWCAA